MAEAALVVPLLLDSVTLPISYDWFLLISRLTIAALVLGFLARVARIVANEALAARPAPGLQLVPLNGSQPVPLARSRPLIVGRDSSCDLVIPDPSVSGRHARIEFAERIWTLTDLGSTNGTWLNGARLAEPVSIQAGDIVQFGRFEVEIAEIGRSD
jgi:hypothetical protein